MMMTVVVMVVVAVVVMVMHADDGGGGSHDVDEGERAKKRTLRRASRPSVITTTWSSGKARRYSLRILALVPHPSYFIPMVCGVWNVRHKWQRQSFKQKQDRASSRDRTYRRRQLPQHLQVSFAETADI